jgi:imidazolonepropionase-like amidohydrolase
MILLLRDLEGREHRIGVSDGCLVDPEVSGGPEHDFRSHYAVRGLADCHAHLSGDGVFEMIDSPAGDPMAKMRRNSLLQMQSGVLLLIDKGSKTSLSLRFLGESWRPELEMAGRMIAVPDGYYPGFTTEVDGDLDAVIGSAVDEGAQWVKLVGDWPRPGRGPVANFSEDDLARVVSMVHAAGGRVAIHTTAPETPGMAVRAGVDSIEHGLHLTTDDIVALGERGGAWVPTVLAMESTMEWLGAESTGGRLFSAGLDNVKELLGIARESGVALLTGTDLAIPHGAVALEAARMVDYGLGSRDAVHAVTAAAYEYVGMDPGFSVGSPADVVLFANDPYSDVTELQRPTHIMRAGRVLMGFLV